MEKTNTTDTKPLLPLEKSKKVNKKVIAKRCKVSESYVSKILLGIRAVHSPKSIEVKDAILKFSSALDKIEKAIESGEL